MGGVFGQRAPGVARLDRLPGAAARLQFRGGDEQADAALLCVNTNFVPVFHQRQRPARIGLRRDVADHKAVRPAGKTAVGDQGDVAAQALAGDGAGGGEHLPHAGTAARPFVADDDDVALDHGAVKYFFQRRLLGMEDARPALEAEAFPARDFGDGALRGQVAVKDDQMAVLLDRIGEGADDFLQRRIGRHGGQILRQGFAGDGQAAAVQQTGVQQGLHHRLDAADGDQFGHEIFSARLEVGEDGDTPADGGEIIQGEFDAGAPGDGQQVEDGVGRAAQGNDDGDGVFKGAAGHNVRGPDALLEQGQDGRAGAAAIILFGLGNGVLGGAVGQAHPQGLDGAGHGVGRVHAAARTGAGNGAGLDLFQLGVVNFLVGVRPHRFKDGNNVQLAGIAGDAAGQNGAAINKNRRTIQPRHRHHRPRHVFVATADGHKAVQAFAADHRFDGIGNDLAGDQGVFHPFRSHGNAVGNGDGVEDNGLAAGAVDALFGQAGQLINVGVAGRDHAPGGGDADLRLAEILLFESDGVKHGTAGGALRPVHHDGGMGARGRFGFGVCRGSFDFHDSGEFNRDARPGQARLRKLQLLRICAIGAMFHVVSALCADFEPQARLYNKWYSTAKK